MIIPASFKFVPISLLAFIASAPAQSQDLEPRWPYNLPPSMKYFPEDESLIQRRESIQRKLKHSHPAGVQKMPSDEGQMFFPEYWRFDDEEDHITNSHHMRKIPVRPRDEESGSPTIHRDYSSHWSNDTLLYPLQAPFKMHTNDQLGASPLLERLPRLARAISALTPRDYTCPGGTFACTQPNTCCGTGETCQTIPESRLGTVGCCPQGQNCGGKVSDCPRDYTGCPSSSGGGCCIPGYSCSGVGCEYFSSQLVSDIANNQQVSRRLPSLSTPSSPPTPA